MRINWKVGLIRIPINGLVIAVTSLLLPSMEVEPGIVNLILLGMIFGLLNAFVKPIVQFFTLSLIFVTGGAIVILINGIMLWLLSLILPELLAFDGLLAILIAAVIVGLVALALESLLGVTPPIIDRTLIESDGGER